MKEKIKATLSYLTTIIDYFAKARIVEKNNFVEI